MFTNEHRPEVKSYIYVSLVKQAYNPSSYYLPLTFRIDNPSLERISVKKLRSVEKGYEYPIIDVVHVKGEVGWNKRTEFSSQECDSSAYYECVQTVSKNKEEGSDNANSSLHGYMFFAYKTMEDMHTIKFTKFWKTWSGARMLFSRMPKSHTVSKLTFYKRVSGNAGFEYILIAKVNEMMRNAAPALNVLHYMKPKVCAYVGCYRKSVFQLSDDIEFHCDEKKIDLINGKVSTEVQTDSIELKEKPRRRILPRTASGNITPFSSKFLISERPDVLTGCSTLTSPDGSFHSEMRRMSIVESPVTFSTRDQNEYETRVVRDESLIRKLKTQYFNSPEYTAQELFSIDDDVKSMSV